MPKSAVKKAKQKAQRRKASPVALARRRRNHAAAERLDRKSPDVRVVYDNTHTYVLVPVDEYERLLKAEMVENAITKLQDKDADWVDADDFALELAAERIAKARKVAGLTQTQLGKKLGLPQSQISRIERNPDRTTVRTLKRIARALGVDVSALV